jgi:hypothetical protein
VGPGFDIADFQFLADNSAVLAALSPVLGESKTLL